MFLFLEGGEKSVFVAASVISKLLTDLVGSLIRDDNLNGNRPEVVSLPTLVAVIIIVSSFLVSSEDFEAVVVVVDIRDFDAIISSMKFCVNKSSTNSFYFNPQISH